jgi:hypothetical protein
MINYLALLTALAVSGVSAYYSIIGLTAIFSSQFWPIVIMGSVLEVGKLVTASWLYRNWSVSSILIKTYLTSAVIVLMFITSMGIFGFLSRAHIEQSLTINSGGKEQVAIIQNNIDVEKQYIDDLNTQIQQIDAAITKMTDRGQANSSLRAAEQQRKTRDSLVIKKDTHVKNISTLTQERIKYESETRKLEAEVGPIKYIAELIHENGEAANLESAVRYVIILLVLVFDPLAVILLIAANQGIARDAPVKKVIVRKRKQLTSSPKALKIDSDKVFKQ